MRTEGIANVFARGGGAGEDENAGADDGANAQGGEADPAEGLFEAALRLVSVAEELVDALGAEELRVHGHPWWKVGHSTLRGSDVQPLIPVAHTASGE